MYLKWYRKSVQETKKKKKQKPEMWGFHAQNTLENRVIDLNVKYKTRDFLEENNRRNQHNFRVL